MAGTHINKLIKKADIILAVCAAAAALVLSVVFWLKPFEGQLYASVYIDGEFIEAIPLQEELSETEIKTQYGTNTIMILDDKVYINESDCTYQQCVASGSISRISQSLVCAPHSLVVTIEDEKTLGGK